jgi:putative phosphoribosyl transferase
MHLPFGNRFDAGRVLAAELSSGRLPADTVVLGLARGGVAVGFAVARELGLKLDVVVARKIGVPWQPELAMGALAGASRVLDETTIRLLDISHEEVSQAVSRELGEMRRREELYRPGAPIDLFGRTALLIDDGLATGATMLAAIRHTRSCAPEKVVVAVPVASLEASRLVRAEADNLITLATPRLFGAVSEFYIDFHQVSDVEVQSLLAGSEPVRYNLRA